MGESEYAVNFFIVFTGGWLGVQRPPQTFLKVLSVFFSALPRDVGALQHVLLSQQMLCVALFSTVVLFRCLCFLFKFDKFINQYIQLSVAALFSAVLLLLLRLTAPVRGAACQDLAASDHYVTTANRK